VSVKQLEQGNAIGAMIEFFCNIIFDECTFDCTVLYIIACEKLNDVTNVPILHAVL